MNIVVCLKQVPDTTVVKIDPKTGTLIRDGVPSIINPEDKHALEAALQLKDNHGAHVTVVSMGPPQAKNALREALCMGADEAILLTDRAFGGADTLATSKTIAAAIKKLDYDIIFGGRQAIDGDTAQVGPEIAEHLGIPQVTYVQDVKIEEDGVVQGQALFKLISKKKDTFHRKASFNLCSGMVCVHIPYLIPISRELFYKNNTTVAGRALVYP